MSALPIWTIGGTLCYLRCDSDSSYSLQIVEDERLVVEQLAGSMREAEKLAEWWWRHYPRAIRRAAA
jgi:hypothetical protein